MTKKKSCPECAWQIVTKSGMCEACIRTGFPGTIRLESWGGTSVERVLVVGATPTRYRVMVTGTQKICLPGRDRWLGPDQVALVPKRHVKLDDEAQIEVEIEHG